MDVDRSTRAVMPLYRWVDCSKRSILGGWSGQFLFIYAVPAASWIVRCPNWICSMGIDAVDHIPHPSEPRGVSSSQLTKAGEVTIALNLGGVLK